MNTGNLQRFTMFVLICGLLCAVSADAQNFRVTLNGFRADIQTHEGAFEVDGRGDEIASESFVGVVKLINNSPVLLNPPLKHLTSTAVRGVMAGNCFPASCPVGRLTSPVSNASQQLPLILFEGGIEQGNALVIIPTIWELDESNAIRPDLLHDLEVSLNTLHPDYLNFAQGLILSRSSTSFLRSGTSWGINNTMELPGSVPRNRPIGMNALSGINRFGFMPQMLILNPQTLDSISRRDPLRLGRGIISVQYKDVEFMGGDYTLFLQIELIP